MGKVFMVLLPGLDGTGELLSGFVKAAPEGYEAMVISYPAGEKLSYEELGEFVEDRLPRGEEFIIVAESFSGPVGVLAAAARPKGLLGLVLCNSFVVRPISRLWRYFPWRLWFRLPMPRFIIGRYLTGDEADTELIEKVRKVIRGCDPRVMAFRVREILKVDVRKELARINSPMLDIRGEQDHLVGKGALEAMLEVNPAIVHKAIAGPHFLLQVAPEEAWQVIDAFVKEKCGGII